MRPIVKCVLSLICLIVGCSTGRIHRNENELQQAFTEVCSTAKDIREVRGASWVKVSTTEESGQFPSQFHATAPSTLDLEATNLMNSVEAVLKIRGDHYSVKWAGKETVDEEGTGSWRGVPLQWAIDLFLGKFPCPPLDAIGPSSSHDPSQPEVRLISEDNGNIGATVHYPSASVTEKFSFRIKSWAGKSWPEYLKWSRDGVEPQEVEFTFESPDDQTSSPTRVSIQSALGEVKIRWKERRRIH